MTTHQSTGLAEIDPWCPMLRAWGAAATAASLFRGFRAVDLSQRKDDGDGNAKGNDIRKHRNDVFRLLQLLPINRPIEVTEPLKADLRAYVERVNGVRDSLNGGIFPSAFAKGSFNCA